MKLKLKYIIFISDSSNELILSENRNNAIAPRATGRQLRVEVASGTLGDEARGNLPDSLVERVIVPGCEAGCT